MSFRTDRNNNPAAFTTAIAHEAQLIEGVDFAQGEPFTVSGSLTSSSQYFTAKLLKDPIETTIKVIDKIGFYTKGGQIRWTYIGIPKWIWDSLTHDVKVQTIGFMYQHEGGTEMKGLFSAPINIQITDHLKMGDKIG